MACSKAGRKATVIFIVLPTPIISSPKSSKHMEEIFKRIGVHFYSHYEVLSESWFFNACPMLSVNRTQVLHEDAWNLQKVSSFHSNHSAMCKGFIILIIFIFIFFEWVCMLFTKNASLFFFGICIKKPCEQFPF